MATRMYDVVDQFSALLIAALPSGTAGTDVVLSGVGGLDASGNNMLTIFDGSGRAIEKITGWSSISGHTLVGATRLIGRACPANSRVECVWDAAQIARIQTAMDEASWGGEENLAAAIEYTDDAVADEVTARDSAINAAVAVEAAARTAADESLDTRITALEAGGTGGDGMTDEQGAEIIDVLQQMAAANDAPAVVQYVVSDETGADYASLTAAIAAHPGEGVEFLCRGTIEEPTATSESTMFASGQIYRFSAGAVWQLDGTRKVTANNFLILSDGAITVEVASSDSSTVCLLAIDADCSGWNWRKAEFLFSFDGVTIASESGFALLGRTDAGHNLSDSDLGKIKIAGTVTSIASAFTAINCGLRKSRVEIDDDLTNSGTSRSFVRFEGSGESCMVSYRARATTGWTHALCSGDSSNCHLGTAESGVDQTCINTGGSSSVDFVA